MSLDHFYMNMQLVDIDTLKRVPNGEASVSLRPSGTDWQRLATRRTTENAGNVVISSTVAYTVPKFRPGFAACWHVCLGHLVLSIQGSNIHVT